MKLIECETLNLCEDAFEALLKTPQCQVAMMVLEPGQESSEYGNEHPGSDQIYFVVEGEGEAIVRRDSTIDRKGDLLYIEGDDSHQIVAGGSRAMRILHFVAPQVR